MQPLDLQVRVLLDLSDAGQVSNSVCLGPGFTPSQGNLVFESGSDLWMALAMGQSLPGSLVVSRARDLRTLFAVACFLHRVLLLDPRSVEFHGAATLVDLFGVAGEAHVDRDLGRFLTFLLSLLESSDREELTVQLPIVVGFVRTWVLEGASPALPVESEVPRVLERGTEGFVVAECPKVGPGAWTELFRQGFLRGVLFGPSHLDRTAVLVARKSSLVTFDLVQACSVLNEAEGAMGELAEWRVEGNWLRGPTEGTLLLPNMILQVLLRV